MALPTNLTSTSAPSGHVAAHNEAHAIINQLQEEVAELRTAMNMVLAVLLKDESAATLLEIVDRWSDPTRN